MSLNPIQFGKHVIDQFGRYLLTTYPIADARLEEQVRKQLRHDIGGERLLAKGPYIHLHQPFESGPSIDEMIKEKELGLHKALKGVFPFEALHKHQELALRSILAGIHTIMATGTGSGKTEGFLLPIMNECLKMRDDKDTDEKGIVAVLVYPMNALVNDQIERLRILLSGTRITFGRYTGETEQHGDGIPRLKNPRAYTDKELAEHREGVQELPLPWEECYSREEILDRRPRLLLTNYSQLEYLLLRDKDLSLFRHAPLKFLVFDEIHTYTGAQGSEVACLIRRLKHVTGKSLDDVVCIGTSATVQDTTGRLDGEEATRNFAHRLFGVPTGKIEIVTEKFQPPKPVELKDYVPPFPSDPHALLETVLNEARAIHVKDDPGEVPEALLKAAEELCGRQAPPGESYKKRLCGLLISNKLVTSLSMILSRPRLLGHVIRNIRIGTDRMTAADEDLIAEMLSYLTLGAIAENDGEPLRRPKLHYFVQGYQGL